jgi:S-DNA-T family DNA segregation ATPase FtsK/SpoIIIE
MSFVLYSLPMLAGVVAMMLMYSGGTGSHGPLSYVVGGLFGASMLGMVGMGVARPGAKRSDLNDQRRDYLRYLSQVRRDVLATATAQREAAFWQHPDPDGLWNTVLAERMWERRPADPDFGLLRVGIGAQPLATPLVPPQTGAVEDLEPVCALALRRFVLVHGAVADLPVAFSLRAHHRITVSGDRAAAAGLVRALLCQLAAFHSPDDLRVWICRDAAREADWEWAKWLPHIQHPSVSDAVGPVRMVRDQLAELEALAAEDLAERPRFSPGGKLSSGQRHIVVVVDGGRPGAVIPPGERDGILGVTFIELDDSAASRGPDRDTGRHTLRLRVGGADTRDGADGSISGDISVLRRSGAEVLGRADRLSARQAEAFTRGLARYQAGHVVDEGSALSTDLGLTDLLGVGDPGRVDPAVVWRPRADRDRLRIPIGVDDHSHPIELDLKESAQEGMGPHGLLIGATGSGKSELLRTLVTGLALTHSPERLNFVLVDFKGGATFAGLGRLPHTAAVITNLADDLALVDRMRDALQGELNRRQEQLHEAGNFASVRDHERAREAGLDLRPLPSLLVICDEFSELLSVRPEFIDVFVSIGRLGRSLGVHLLLASQRLEEGRLRGLESHLSYRIGLRTFSAMESRIVLGTPAAAELPPIPGSGYLKSDNSTLSRFKAAYISGPYQASTADGPAPAAAPRRILPFSTGFVQAGAEVRPVGGPPRAEPSALAATIMDVIIDRLDGHGPAAHQVWLPPLAEPPSLGALLEGVGPDAGDLSVPVAIEDRPLEQRQAPLRVGLASGNAVVIGAPQSGKSTALLTLVTGLAATHSPQRLQFYCLDYGGGALTGLLGLPHVGAVANRREPELVRRTLAELRGLLNSRERAFQELGIDSAATFRRLRAKGPVGADAWGDVVLVIDGWQSFKSEFDAMDQMAVEQVVADIATRGPGFGVHVVLSTSRWYDLRANLRDVFGTRVELRIGDPGESLHDRRLAAAVPTSAPGRGVSPDRLHLLTALPRLDGGRQVADLADGMKAAVAEIAARWPDQAAPAVRLLPRLLPAEALPAPAAGGRVPVGLRESDLETAFLDFAADPHFLCFGDVESGRTGFLRLLLDRLTRQYSPDEALIAVADYRRGLLDVAHGEHFLGYATSGATLRPLVSEIAAAMNERLPGPDITPQQLRSRSWWRGPELFLVVDDHDLVVTAADNPLAPLLELLPQARDIGLHLIVARPVAGAQRAMFEPLTARLRELGSPGLILSGDRAEGALLGKVKPSLQPPGRGVLVSRRAGEELIQLAWHAPEPDEPAAG